MNFGSSRVQSVTCKEWESVNEGGNDGKYGSHRQHIVEVGYYVISVMENNVQ